MISEKELLQTIRECERVPVTYNSCERLASFYIIYDHLFGEKREPKVVHESVEIIRTDGDSEFLRMVDGIRVEEFLAIMDELVTQTVKVINPRLYEGVLQRLER